MNPTSTEAAYDLRGIPMAPVAGLKLRLAVALLESPLGGLLLPRLLRESGISWFREQTFEEAPAFGSPHAGGAIHTLPSAVPVNEWPTSDPAAAHGFRFATVHDYARAYRDGTTSPVEVAERVLQAIVASDRGKPPLRAMIAVNREDLLHQAEASAQRIQTGAALSVLDGIPVGVKDELHMHPYPTTAGTSFLGREPSTSDATVVARLRAAGALLIGKTNMHEIGVGVTGLNLTHGTPRNPYAMDHHTGGSSSGSAAAVAAGLCPIAIGGDGGGSIRIPAALCGVVGLKPTYGRISGHGAVPLGWSVGHLSPVGATVTDTALAYAVMAGPDPSAPVSLRQPLPTLAGWNTADLRGVKLGIYRRWFSHADAEVVSICEAMLDHLREKGATVCEVVVPDLEAARIAHTVTICSEMAEAVKVAYAEHRRELGPDARLALRVARALTATDYVRAQRVRARMLDHFSRAFAEVDAIVTPTTAIVAPPVPEAALQSGISDLSTLGELMRFATSSNLTGHPAITFPAGYTARGLPVGFQAIGRAWEEPLLLRIALAGESCLERKAPAKHFQLLPK